MTGVLIKGDIDTHRGGGTCQDTGGGQSSTSPGGLRKNQPADTLDLRFSVYRAEK